MKHSLFLAPLFALGMAALPGLAPARAADASPAYNELVATAPYETVTKTVEKTTRTDYTVTTRRVGMVGGRPYPATTRTVQGGEKVETFVNDARVDTRIVRPEPDLPQPGQPRRDKTGYGTPVRAYYTSAPAADVLKDLPADVTVRATGRLND